jgi:transposase
MESISASKPSADGARSTLFVALELRRSTWLVALHSPIADKVS